MYRQPTKYHKSFRWQEAVSKIKALSKQNRSNNARANTVQEIYHNVHKTEQNKFVMNALLTFCLKSNDTQTIMDLHEDVIHTPDVSVGLLIQCCKQLVKSDINITVKLLDHIYTTMNDSEMKIKTTLIDLYSKCLQLDRAIQVFESVSVSNRDAILIGVMMKSFTYHHQFERAMDLFESYHQSNPPMHSAHDSLKIFYIEACTKTNNIGKAEQLITASLETECVNVWLNTRFIYFYDTIQQVNKAWNVFKVQMDGNHVDIICLNAMLKCFINHKQYTNSMDLYHTFVGKISFNDLSHLLYIKALKQSDTKNVEIVRDIFNQIINDKKQIHNSKTRTVLVGSIMKYMIDSDASAQAVEVYENCDDRIEHDDVSYLLYLRACSNTNSHQKGMHLINTISRIHHRSIELINTIIDFYGHCNAIQDAQRIFDAISDSKRNYITLSVMMKCFINNDLNPQAMAFYKEFGIASEDPEDVLKMLYIKACSACNEYDTAQQYITDNLNIKNDVNTYSVELLTSLIDFYGASGDIDAAKHVFNHISHQRKRIAHFNAMMNALNNNNKSDEALHIFNEIDIEMNAYCYSIALHCCANSMSLADGVNIIQTLKPDIVENLNVVAAMICMYAKCGHFEEAIQIFDAHGVAMN